MYRAVDEPHWCFQGNKVHSILVPQGDCTVDCVYSVCVGVFVCVSECVEGCDGVRVEDQMVRGWIQNG